MKIIEIKLRKIQSLYDAAIPDSKIPEGYIRIMLLQDETDIPPVVGQRFPKHSIWRTSEVQKILTEDTFQTHNSIWSWEITDEVIKYNKK